MLIEDLVRLGRPLLNGLTAKETLSLIADVGDERVKNYYRNVFVVLLPADGAKEPIALARQVFGTENTNGNFSVACEQALGAPFVLPSGGNQLNPQGRYGVPVYPVYHKHIHGNPKAKSTALQNGFRKSVEAVRVFLQGRVDRTPGLKVSSAEMTRIAETIHDTMRETDFTAENKNLGILVLARCTGDGVYELLDERSRHDRIGETADGRAILPNIDRILPAVWEAKLEEGREAGSREGPCTLSGHGDTALSAYCKAWPWAFPTWNCPLPAGGDAALMVEGIGLAPDSYRAPTLGACVFNRLTRRLSSLVLPELFSTGNARPAQDVRRRDWKKLTSVYGSAFLLPVTETWLTEPEARHDFVAGVRGMLAANPADLTQADRYFTAVTGFDTFLPPELDQDDYRLTLVYFSGDYTRGDIKLRACIQDVIPSVVGRLRTLARTEAKQGVRLVGLLSRGLSEKQAAYLARCYESVPYLLARAYGGAFLWSQLEGVLRRRSLDTRRVTANAARRMESLVPTWPDSWPASRDEVAFLLHVREFVRRVNAEIATPSPGETDMPMRPWKDLIRSYERDPVEDVRFESAGELGFACGLLVRRFGWWYTSELGRDKDYLKHKVLTFGSDLSPRDVWVRAIKGISEAAQKYPKLKAAVELGQLAYYPSKDERKRHTGDFDRRLGVVLAELGREQFDLHKCRDEFMTGFWAGYALQGYDRPRKPKTETNQPTTANQE